ncbi:hypothetical protein MUK42_37562 [Musa troglodytarum]|uniref:Uncharacterized protein n=1 Tax=Musa troglodytarum TaxID=320322 RepID=A0A9E7GXQ9_9LILI|nr:hypothetical protein MUK42_37562 [Musa troglodytarum]
MKQIGNCRCNSSSTKNPHPPQPSSVSLRFAGLYRDPRSVLRLWWASFTASPRMIVAWGCVRCQPDLGGGPLLNHPFLVLQGWIPVEGATTMHVYDASVFSFHQGLQVLIKLRRCLVSVHVGPLDPSSEVDITDDPTSARMMHRISVIDGLTVGCSPTQDAAIAAIAAASTSSYSPPNLGSTTSATPLPAPRSRGAIAAASVIPPSDPTAGRPVRSSRRRTPKLYTSVFLEAIPVRR